MKYKIDDLEYDELIGIKRALKCASLKGFEDKPILRALKKVRAIIDKDKLKRYKTKWYT